MFVKNQSGQVVGAQLNNVGTGQAFVGAVTVFVTLDNQTQVIGSVNGGLATAMGNGYFTYAPSAGETNANDCAYTFTGASAITQTVQYATVTPSQQSALSTATGGLSASVATIIADAFREITVFAPNATIPPDDFTFGLGKLNRLFDNMSNDRRLTFAQNFNVFTLIPNQQTVTIGPNSANFTVVNRPIDIRAAQLVLTDVNPNVYLPIDVITWEEWKAIPVRNIATSIPYKLYYDAQFPNGNINLYPIPTIAYNIELVSRVHFNLVGAADTFWLPPGYRDYCTLKLAKSMAPAYPGAIFNQSAAEDLKELTSSLFNTNIKPPKIATRDSGIPGGHRGSRDLFNYRSRTFG